MTSFLDQRIAVAAVTRGSVRLWAVNDPSGTKPELVLREPEDDQHKNHYKQVQRNNHHGVEKFDRVYFEEVADFLRDAKEILLIGHGHGKANEMLLMVQYLERHHPDIAARIVGAEDANLEALTDNQVLAMAKAWFAEPVHLR